MPKTLSDNTKSSSRYFQKGVFVDRAKILTVEDLSNYPKKPGAEIRTVGEKGWQPELCLKLKVDVGIEMDMYVMGKYKWKTDPISGKKGEYLGWKQKYNAVQNLLVKLLGSNAVINDDDTISSSTLNKLIGLEFFKLRYCQPKKKMYEGKPSFQTWDIFEKAVEGNDEVLYREWLKAAIKSDYYDPNLFDEWLSVQKDDQTSFDPSKFKDSEESPI